MRFTKLRLAGFKSFVDPAEFAIQPGLTGIVGPNGCGKSNLVEALQWAMGESSARKMRGGEMDDVIFGGTASRPARNIASVTIGLENNDGKAPAAFASYTDIEIERRIDRGKGSSYRVNGRETRARDVQILFADLASGAGSSALIGQGRMGWLVTAKPAERRLLLEEAAGIAGLQARRHDALLRVAAAEQNLTRIEDVTQNLSQQIDRLKRQVRQTERYRILSREIRRVEAWTLYSHYQERVRRHAEAGTRLTEAGERAVAMEREAEAAEAARLAAASSLPELHAAAAEAEHAVERLRTEHAALEAEKRRIVQLLEDHRRQLGQIGTDRARETARRDEAAAALQRLEGERDTLIAAQDGEIAAQSRKDAELRDAQQAVSAAERELAEASRLAASLDAEHAALRKRFAAIEERRRRHARQKQEAEAREREFDLLAVPPERLAAANERVATEERAIDTARLAGESAEQASRAAEIAEAQARDPLRAAEQALSALKSEIGAIERLLATGESKRQPVLEQITVAKGYETALGAALGDDLLASLDPAAPVAWREIAFPEAGDAALPPGAEPLSGLVTAPARLARRFRHIGLVPDVATGDALQKLLAPGQRLVSRDGSLWRWDGLRVAAGAPTAAALRLAQRNRLTELRLQEAEAATRAATAETQLRAAADAVRSAREQDRTARENLRDATRRHAEARSAEATLIQQASAAESRRQTAIETLRRLAAEGEEIETQAAELAEEQGLLPDAAATRAEAERLRLARDSARETERQIQRALDLLMREAAMRRDRIAGIDADVRAWQGRAADAERQMEILGERAERLADEAARIEAAPAELAERATELAAGIEAGRHAAEAARRGLAEAETAARTAETAATGARIRLGDAREARVRAEGALEHAAEAEADAVRRIAQIFECAAEKLPEIVEFGAEPGAGAEAGEALLDRLKRDRDAIGPVNLVAETELAEVQTERETILREAADCAAAIAKLRQAIHEINKEGRERLTAAFTAIDLHFRELFTRLFGGGHAHLELVQHESDPLASGLEIFASPPGKKLQTLSLLSGGERTLTALALVFAMFLTNPAPICVLDEVDAPLDDANVERFCHLVREISGRTGTCFLVITHHRVSMARMDRLYGVTMMEKGISRLVSVDLVEADRLRETA